MKKRYIYSGAIHIHTKYSDGTASLENVAKYAKKAGLKWIVVTDHNTLKGLEKEGWYNDLAVIVGSEISPEHSDHYLALDIKEEISEKTEPKNYVQEVKNQGGFGFIAHPDESLKRKYNHSPLRWTDWSIKDFGGLEIWNYLSDWTDNYDPKQALYCFLKRNNILTGPSKKTLNWWDNLNTDNPEIIPAIGGVDAHALHYKYFKIKVEIFPYISTFKTITNHIVMKKELSTDFNEAKEQILNALKNGNNIIENKHWNKQSKSVPIYYVENDDKIAFSGEKIELTNNSKLVLKLPQKGLIRLIYDGQLVWECHGEDLTFQALDKGKYRAEVFFKGKPWIFTNPILIE